jgi:hypothetical protein
MSEISEMQRAILKKMFDKSSISAVQLSPNSACNNRCWYCPVHYQPMPFSSYGSMSVASLERILSQLAARDGSIVNAKLRLIQTAHYNEVLLYPHFEEMLGMFRKYGFSTMVLSNGQALTHERSRTIADYSDVIQAVHLNVPAGNAEDYEKYTGTARGTFDRLVDNIDYFLSVSKGGRRPWFTIGVDGLSSSDTRTKLLSGSPVTVTAETTQKQREQLAGLFPGVTVGISPLMDRAGWLRDLDVLDSSEMYPRPDQVIVGCSDPYSDPGIRSRMFSWAHINARGDMFLCCNDYAMEYAYGNCLEKPTAELWRSKERLEMIARAADSICRRCSFALGRQPEEVLSGHIDTEAPECPRETPSRIASIRARIVRAVGSVRRLLLPRKLSRTVRRKD